MSGQQIVLNAVTDEPTLSDLLNLLKKEIFFDLACHHVGTIQSFNPVLQTVQATVNYTKTYFQLNATTNLYQATPVSYSVIVDAPLIMLGGGAAHATFPITKGDECLLLFNDRDMDNWFVNGSTTQPNASSRAHSFSDAFALVGVKSKPNVLTSYDNVRAIFTNGTVKVGINPATGKATILNTTTTLGTVLGNLNTALSSLATSLGTVATQLGGNPAVETAAAAAGTSLATAATALSSALTSINTLTTGLLE
jgi:hypothetical protein